MTKYTVIISWSEEDDVFIAMTPELNGCIAHGDTTTQALENLNQAIAAWLKAAKEFGWEIPEEV